MPPSPVLLADAIDVLSASSGLLHDVTVSQAIHFITTASRLLGDIQHHRPRTDQDNDDAPPCLSPQIAFVLSKLTEIDLKWIPTCWNAFKDVVWASSTTEDIAATNTEAFKLYGLAHEFSEHSLFPPSQCCATRGCPQYGRRLAVAEHRQVILFTLRGAYPTYYTYLRCHGPSGCQTVYHYNYSVQDRTRYYHSGVPDIIQVGAHHFIERSVINLFVNLQVAAWTSFTHCADIYNESIGPLSGYVDEIWSFKMALRTEHVRDAINTLALLEESEMDRTYLVVPHDGSQEDRLVEAMKASHERTVAYGQRDGNHACKKCVHAWEDKDGKRWRITAAVTDGITIGRPCCSRHNCKNPLLSNRDRFCPEHSDDIRVCAISECDNPIQAGSLTCHDPTHQAVEAHHRSKGQAMFQLKARLERARVSHPTTTFPTGDEDNIGDEAEVDVPVCPDKPAQGNRRAKARFGRRWTHNEQIIVRCCGYIISHCTLYGSEALNSVKEFIEASFPKPGTMPNYLFYDNNCGLSKLIRSQGSQAFEKTGLPVDVFHFEKKHSQNDVYCQQNCNPASFPELINGDKWVFNSSIAEQTNVWLGGYHAIVREMTAVQYNFFLDLMIRKRNEVTIKRLEEAGFNPCLVQY